MKHLPDEAQPPTGCGGGGGEHDYEADRQKRRFRLEQGWIRHRHLAIVLIHDGIAGSVDHTPKPEQTAARHALEEEKTYDRRRHLECGGQTSVRCEQLGRGRHRRRGRRGYADDLRIVQGMAGPLPLQSDPQQLLLRPLPVQGLRHQHPRPDPRERERVRRLASQGDQGARRPGCVRRMGSRRRRSIWRPRAG